MSRRADLPGEDRVREVVAEVIAAAAENGRKPAVVTVARQLGISNPSFWRHFPDIARELVELGRAGGASPAAGNSSSRHRQLEQENAQLRRDKAQLRRDLNLATAVIQRLALENDQRRRELEAAGKVTRLRTRDPSGR